MLRTRHALVAFCALAGFSPGSFAAAQTATAHLQSADGDEVGVVGFVPLASGGVHITVAAAGLPPGIRGIHIHAVGDCDPADGYESAGGHFNPSDAAHGWDAPDGPHAGDLPNLHVHEDGTVAVEFFSHLLSLEDGAESSLLAGDGTAVVIHAHADDYRSDPAGEAGERIACGVIERE